SPSFFRVLGAQPRLGAFFGDEELLPGRAPQVVISSTFWKQVFDSDPEVVGKTLTVEGVPHTVVAVTGPEFSFPDWEAELWLPLAFRPDQRAEAARLWNNYRMIARLAPGASLEQARAELAALDASILERASPDVANQLTQAGYRAHLAPMHDDLVREVRPFILLLGAGAAFVLLIAGISLSNLQLVRITGRLPELATRYVLGAGRLRLLRQLLTENLLVTAVGAGVGIATGMWGLRFLSRFEPWEIPRIAQLSLSPSAAGLLILLAFASMTVSSLLASWILRRKDLFSLMRQGASTASGEDGRWRGGLVAAQVAVAFILMAGASLLTVSLRNLMAEDLGFDTENVQACALRLPPARYESAADRRGFYDSLLTEVESLPAVRHAALSTLRPFSGSGSRRVLTPERPPTEGEDPNPIAAPYQASVSPGFFDALDIQLLAGRTFGDGDRHDTPRVMVVSEAVALRHWPPGNALGQRVRLEESSDTWWTVIGVVEEIRQESIVEPQPVGTFYLPIQQYDASFLHLFVRAETLAGLLPALSQRVHGLDPETPLFWASTLAEAIDSSLISVRLPLRILLIFAAVALALAAVGIFGVLSQAVACRTKEIGIRLALGGSRGRVWRWAFLHLTRFVVVGWAVGLAAALALSGLMRSLVYGIQPHEPWVFLGVSGLLLAVAYGVALLPAMKATSIDPCRVLTAALVACCLGLAPISDVDPACPGEGGPPLARCAPGAGASTPTPPPLPERP
ncbi:MAG: ABC transporter permease, partial [Acidobacteriota bacterium]